MKENLCICEGIEVWINIISESAVELCRTMGQCPNLMMSSEGDGFYYDIVKCMSLDNHHEPETFLVVHEFDEQNLIDKVEIERILEKEFQDYLLAGGNDSEAPEGASNNEKARTQARNESNEERTGGCILMANGEDDEESAVLCHGPLFVETTLKHHGDVLRLKMPANFGDFYTKRYLQKPPQLSSSKSMPINFVDINGRDNKYAEDTMPKLVVSYSQESDFTDNRDVENRRDSPQRDPILLSSNGTSFLNLAVQGNLGIAIRNDLHHNIDSNITPQLLLMNERTEELVALCRTKTRRHGLLPTVRVYSPRPRSVNSQAVDDVTYNDSPLHLWAELNAEGEFPLPMEYTISLANDHDGKIEQEPSYRGKHVDVGKICVKMMGQTNGETHHSGCCLIQMTKKEPEDDVVTSTSLTTKINSNCANKDYNSEVFLSLSISRGIDPALFICLTSFIGELLESAMRRQVARIDQHLIKRQYSLYSYDGLD